MATESTSPIKPPRKLLMVAYEFPPFGSGGVARTLKFARYLPSQGWQPHVLTVRNPAGGGFDATLLEELSASVRIRRTRGFEHHAVAGLLARLAGAIGLDEDRWSKGLTWRLGRLWKTLAIPDRHIYWAAPAILAGIAQVWRHKLDAIYSTSWPYSDHIAATAISAVTGRPWIADFRDPWTQHMNYRADRTRNDRMQSRLERMVCRKARFIITPAKRSTRALRRLFPDLPAEKFATIRNGFDPADFADPVESLPGFEIIHAGLIYKSRQPGTFVDGLQQFLARVPEAKAHTRARFFGHSLDSDLSCFEGIDCLEMHGWTAHQDVVNAVRESNVLFLLNHSEARRDITVPWKVYEYMASGNHILTVQTQQLELDRIIRSYGNATVLRTYEAEAIADALEKLYRRWANGQLQSQTPPPFALKINRPELTRQLVNLLDRAVDETSVKPNRSASHPGNSIHPAGLRALTKG